MPFDLPPSLRDALAPLDRADEVVDPDELRGHLQASLASVSEPTDDERRAIRAEMNAWTFQPRTRGHRSPWGLAWCELASGTNQAGETWYLPDAMQVDAPMVEHWIARAQSAAHPVGRARYADLAWDIGKDLNRRLRANAGGDSPTISRIPIEVARIAIDGYLDSVERGLVRQDSVVWGLLERALELASSVRDSTRRARARALIVAGVSTMWAGRDDNDLLRFDDVVWEQLRGELSDEERAGVVAALEAELRARTEIAAPDRFNPHLATDLAERLGRWYGAAGSAARSQEAVLRAGKAFEAAAAKASPLLAVNWLQSVMSAYRGAQLPGEALRIEQTIRALGPRIHEDMKAASMEFEVTKADLQSFVDQILRDDVNESLRRCAVAFLYREDRVERSLRASLKDTVFLSHIPISFFDSHGFPTAKIGSLEDDLAGRVADHAATLFALEQIWLRHTFEAIRERHAIDAQTVISHMQPCGLFDEEFEGLVRRGVDAWLARDWVTAIHILVPRIEAALRKLLARMGGSVRRPDERYGGFSWITLGAILSDPVFVAGVPQDARFHLRVLLTDPRGVNLRNQVAHGLAAPEAFNEAMANSLVHALLLVASFRPVIRPAAERQPSGGAPGPTPAG